MEKLLILIATLLFSSITELKAQDELEPSKREKLEALKVAYLTEKLSLTPEEAQVFWPVYNELEERMRKVRKEQRDNRTNTRQNFGSMGDAEVSKAIDQELVLEQRELDLKKQYNERFKKILPIKKVAQLHDAEHGFRKELLRGAKDKNRPTGGTSH